MLELQNLTLRVVDKTLLSEASVRLESHYRVGLVGRNGSGKSTLLKYLLGLIGEESGRLILGVKPEDIGYLEQNLPDGEATAIEFVKRGDWRWAKVQDELTAAEEADDGEAIAHCYEQMQAVDGYTIDARAGKILHGLGFSDEEFPRKIKTFSGGWQIRLQLAKVLMSNAHLLLLDEPTNHLDIDAIVWLGNWLKKNQAMQIIISHDRDFLDQVCTQIVHLNHQQLKLYNGNYSSFQKQYAEQRLLEGRSNKKAEAKRAHLEDFVRRFRAKASKAKQAQSRIKALEKLEVSISAQEESVYSFQFPVGEEITGPVLVLKGDVGYGEDHVLFPQLNLSLYHGDRIGIVGRNGIGKTTLLSTLAGEHQLVHGEVVAHGKLTIAYYAQNQADQFDDDETPLAILIGPAHKMPESKARAFLGRIGFSGNRVHEPIKNFSGGERSRLALALLSLKKPQLLILDEPTNHLDLESKEALILSLTDFTGAVVMVSHDRHFMSSTVNQIYYVADQQLHQLEQNGLSHLDDIIEQLTQKKSTQKVKKDKAQPITEKANPMQIAKIEKELNKAAEKLQALEQELAKLSATAHAELLPEFQAVSERYAAAQSEVEKLEAKWLALNDS